jgi:hypothetical protein
MFIIIIGTGPPIFHEPRNYEEEVIVIDDSKRVNSTIYEMQIINREYELVLRNEIQSEKKISYQKINEKPQFCKPTFRMHEWNFKF